ncbi:hypothetical protein V8E36_004879 [Tilletia maclaganii]
MQTSRRSPAPSPQSMPSPEDNPACPRPPAFWFLLPPGRVSLGFEYVRHALVAKLAFERGCTPEDVLPFRAHDWEAWFVGEDIFRAYIAYMQELLRYYKMDDAVQSGFEKLSRHILDHPRRTWDDRALFYWHQARCRQFDHLQHVHALTDLAEAELEQIIYGKVAEPRGGADGQPPTYGSQPKTQKKKKKNKGKAGKVSPTKPSKASPVVVMKQQQHQGKQHTAKYLKQLQAEQSGLRIEEMEHQLHRMQIKGPKHDDDGDGGWTSRLRSTTTQTRTRAPTPGPAHADFLARAKSPQQQHQNQLNKENNCSQASPSRVQKTVVAEEVNGGGGGGVESCVEGVARIAIRP